jgi:two-component system OmpR family sensor kinase
MTSRTAVRAGAGLAWVAALVLTAVFTRDLRVYVRFAPVLGVAALGVAAAATWLTIALVRRHLDRVRAETRAEAATEHHRFLRRLDHELKNPLTAMRLGLANAAADGLSPAAESSVRSVEEQVARLARITGDLRKLADIEARPLERVPVDIGAMLEDAGEAVRDLPGGAEREVSVSVPKVPWPLPHPPGDPDLLGLALENLVGNAVKYSLPGSRIELRAFEEDGYVVVEVADTGQGIPADELPYVWGELVRGSDARGTPGSGLGLALVHAVVERHGGRCHIRSVPASGTVVRLRLPVPRTPARPAATVSQTW